MKKMVIVALMLIIAILCVWSLMLIRNISNAASQVSSQYSEAFGTLSPLQTAASYGIVTPVPEGQLSVATTRVALEALQWFVFTEETVDGQPALIAKLTTEGEKHYPGVGSGFTGIFLGDPNNLSQIRITVLRTDMSAQGLINGGPWLIQNILANLLPFSPDEKGAFFDWIDANFLTVPVAGKQEMAIKNVQFLLERPESDTISLTVIPQK